MLGIANLLPFNCIIVPVDFWAQFYEPIFLSAASMSYNLGNWLAIIYMMLHGHKHRYSILIMAPIAAWLVCLIVIPVLHPLISDKMAKTVVTLFPVTVAGLVTSPFQSTIFGIGSRVDFRYNQAISMGNGLAGLVPQAVLVIIKLIFTFTSSSPNLFAQTIVYFTIGVVFIVLCLVMWLWA